MPTLNSTLLAMFGGPVIWTHLGVPATVSMIRENPSEGTSFGTVEVWQPVFRAIEADIVGVAAGDTLTQYAESWTVVRIRPDGSGMLYLDTRKVELA